MTISIHNARLAALALSVSFSLPALALDAHVHGVANMDVVVDNQQITLHVHTPLANLIGFEHPPKTDKDRQTVRDMSAHLRKVNTAFIPTAAARCELTSVKLDADNLSGELLGESSPSGKQHAHAHEHQHDQGHNHKHSEGDVHADLEGTFIFTCANIQQLHYIDVPLLTAFQGINQLDVQVVTPTRQSAATLNATSTRIELK